MEIPKIPNARYIDVTKFFLISRPPAQEQNPLTLVAPLPRWCDGNISKLRSDIRGTLCLVAGCQTCGPDHDSPGWGHARLELWQCDGDQSGSVSHLHESYLYYYFWWYVGTRVIFQFTFHSLLRSFFLGGRQPNFLKCNKVFIWVHLCGSELATVSTLSSIGLEFPCLTTPHFSATTTLEVSKVLVIVNGVLAVVGPAVITINLLLLTLDIGAKGRINGEKYKTFIILRNRELIFTVPLSVKINNPVGKNRNCSLALFVSVYSKMNGFIEMVLSAIIFRFESNSEI